MDCMYVKFMVFFQYYVGFEGDLDGDFDYYVFYSLKGKKNYDINVLKI